MPITGIPPEYDTEPAKPAGKLAPTDPSKAPAHPWMALGTRILGTGIGGLVGDLPGAMVGAGLSEALAEKLFENRPISPIEVAGETALQLINPLAGPAKTVLGSVAKGVVGGAMTGVASEGARSLAYEHKIPSVRRLAEGGAGGAVFGGAFRAGHEAWRMARPPMEAVPLPEAFHPSELRDPAVDAEYQRLQAGGSATGTKPIIGAREVGDDEAAALVKKLGDPDEMIEPHRRSLQAAETDQAWDRQQAEGAKATEGGRNPKGSQSKEASGEPPPEFPLRNAIEKLKGVEATPVKSKEKIPVKDRVASLNESLSNKLWKMRESIAGIGDWWTQEGTRTPTKEAYGEYRRRQQNVAADQAAFVKQVNRLIPSRQRQAAVTLYSESGSNLDLLGYMSIKAPTRELRKVHRLATQLTDSEKTVATHLRKYLDDMNDLAIEKGLFKAGAQGYMPGEWAKTPLNLPEMERTFRDPQLQKNPRQLKRKIYENTFSGMLAGGIPADLSIGPKLSRYNSSTHDAIGVREMMDTIAHGAGEAEDGRPRTILRGTGQVAETKEGDSRIIVRPKGIYKEKPSALKVGDEIFDFRAEEGEPYSEVASRLWTAARDMNNAKPGLPLEYGVVDDGGFRKVHSYEDYYFPNHSAAQDYKYLTKAPVGGEPVLMQADIGFHPEDAQWARAMFEPSAVRKSAVGRTILKTGGELKGMLLSGLPAPFHLVHMTGHAGFHQMQEPSKFSFKDLFSPPPVALESPQLQKGLSYGLDLWGHSGAGSWREGQPGEHSSIASKIPLIGKWNTNFGDWMFLDWLPRQKANVFMAALERNKARRPDWDEHTLYSRTVDEMNSAFGGQDWVGMGTTKTTRDIMSATLLAPDFFVSKLKNMVQAVSLEKGGKLGVQPKHPEQFWSMLMIAAGMQYLGLRAANKTMGDGEWHMDRPFSFVTKGGQEYQLRTLPADALRLATDWSGYLAYRLNPMTRPLLELYSHRDAQGRPRSGAQIGEDFVTSVQPIPLQALEESLGREGSTWFRGLVDMMANSSGLHSWRYRSDAEKLLYSMTPQAPIVAQSPYDKESHAAARRIEEATREGQPVNPADARRVTESQFKYRLHAGKISEFESRLRYTKLPQILDLLDASIANDAKDEITAEDRHLQGLLSRGGLSSVPAEYQPQVKAHLSEVMKKLVKRKSPVSNSAGVLSIPAYRRGD